MDKTDVEGFTPLDRREASVPAALLLGLVGWGAWTYWSTGQRAAETQRQAAAFMPTLRTALARREDGPVSLTLPGATAPFDAARLTPAPPATSPSAGWASARA